MKPRLVTVFVVVASVLAGAGCGAPGELPEPRVKILETGPLHLDKLYPSMTGPSQRIEVDPTELEWVTALKTEVVDAETEQPLSEEFFCHAQFQRQDAYRPMVTATGISEIRFPTGFAMPLSRILNAPRFVSDSLTFFGMVLNNHEPEIDRLVKVRATVEYWTDTDVGSPDRLTPLYRATMPMTVENLEEYTPAELQGDVATHCVFVDGLNNHWIVPPGRQLTRKLYPGNFLENDTTVHYGVVHLHNHAVYMRLTDLTTGEVLWQTNAIYEADRVQITEIPVYSSETGFRLFRDHSYEIEALYDNTTDHEIDAMAMMSLYHHPAPPSG